MSISLTIFWGILAAILLIAELMTTGLVSIWFCFGAIITMFAAKAGATILVQLTVFFVVSLALLVLTRPFIKKVIKFKSEATNVDRIIGKEAVVVEKIENSMGAVQVDGKVWTAICEDKDRIIEEGENVEILKIEGVKVIVK